MNYLNEVCPVCKKEFSDEDDIVVCPVCGTPHHRECYSESGVCANEKQHLSGFEWKPTNAVKETPKAFGKQPHIKTVVCPNCHRENPAEEPNCIYCSARLYNDPSAFAKAQPFPTNMPYATQVIEISPDDTLGSHKVGEVAQYVQMNAHSYIPKFFKQEKTGKKFSFNWAAFFFSPYWFFFRKMNVIGIVLMMISLLVTGFCTNQNFVDASNKYYTCAEQYVQGEVSQEEMTQASMELIKTPEVIIMTVTEGAIKIFSGIFANKFYKKKIEKDLTDIKSERLSDDEYRLKVFKRGGVSNVMFGISLIGFYCAEQLLLNFILR